VSSLLSPEEPPRVLVVEDDEDNRFMVMRYLEKCGLAVTGASSGERALEFLADTPFDLVILDVMMPGMNGVEVLQRIRERRRPEQLPVIMATARTGADDIVEALAHGANDYVTKPFDLKVLNARVWARLREARPPPQPGGIFEERSLGAGRVLAGRYELGSPIGEGGDGQVFRARHRELKKDVAVKILRLGTDDEGTLGRFREEGIHACRVNHPNAVSVIDFGVTDDNLAYLVMELLEGRDLAEEIYAQKRLSPARCLQIVRPVCAALAEAHSSDIIHRDIKPANIFLHKTKRGEVVKVLDFGIAKFVGDAKGVRPTRGAMGTLSYAAPERLTGAEVDSRADVYSLGMVIYEMLSGAPPFDTLEHDDRDVAAMHVYTAPPPLVGIVPGLTPDLEQVVMDAIAKEPKDRPSIELLAVRFAQGLRG
jgi:DNA-binding response OmpR family regulator